MMKLHTPDLLNPRPIYRETRWPLDGPQVGGQADISHRQLYKAGDPQEVIAWYMTRIARKMAEDIEKLGYTTHLDIVETHAEWQFHEDPAKFDFTLRGRFPSKQPVPGTGAHCENGRLAGGNIAVPDSINYTYDQITPLGADLILEYHPVAFDTATGHWIYRTND